MGEGLDPGTLFNGRYQVVRQVGAGGMGIVYEVVHLETQRHRALKLLQPGLASEPEILARFRREATIGAAIDSEHVVEVYDAGLDPKTGSPFLVMELLRGRDLRQVLLERGRLPADEVVRLLTQTADALDRTHGAGVVHRDLKPANLFLTKRENGQPLVKVLDFGIARNLRFSSKTAVPVGSPFYMSAEQARGEPVGPASDRYALAQVAFTLLVGEAFWRDLGEGYLDIVERIGRGALPSPTARARDFGVSLPEAFAGWFAQATAYEPSARFVTAQAQVGALAHALAARRATPPERPAAAGTMVSAGAPPAGTLLSSGAGPHAGPTPDARRRSSAERAAVRPGGGPAPKAGSPTAGTMVSTAGGPAPSSRSDQGFASIPDLEVPVRIPPPPSSDGVAPTPSSEGARQIIIMAPRNAPAPAALPNQVDPIPRTQLSASNPEDAFSPTEAIDIGLPERSGALGAGPPGKARPASGAGPADARPVGGPKPVPKDGPRPSDAERAEALAAEALANIEKERFDAQAALRHAPIAPTIRRSEPLAPQIVDQLLEDRTRFSWEMFRAPAYLLAGAVALTLFDLAMVRIFGSPFRIAGVRVGFGAIGLAAFGLGKAIHNVAKS